MPVAPRFLSPYCLLLNFSQIEEARRREQADKIAAIHALERQSQEIMRHKQAMQALQTRIASMQSQLLIGGQKIEDTPQFRWGEGETVRQRGAEHASPPSEYQVRLRQGEAQTGSQGTSRSATSTTSTRMLPLILHQPAPPSLQACTAADLPPTAHSLAFLHQHAPLSVMLRSFLTGGLLSSSMPLRLWSCSVSFSPAGCLPPSTPHRPPCRTLLAKEQARIRQQYEERLRELENERQSVQEDKAQVGSVEGCRLGGWEMMLHCGVRWM